MWTFQGAQHNPPEREKAGMDMASGGSRGPGQVKQPEEWRLRRASLGVLPLSFTSSRI